MGLGDASLALQLYKAVVPSGIRHGQALLERKRHRGVRELKHLLAKDMMPPKPSVLLLEMVEVGELARESDSASESLASFRLLGRSSF